MLKLSDHVSIVANIGPKYTKLLEILEIYTVEDLLYHIPFRYDDYSKMKKIAQLAENETVTVSAVVHRIDNIYTKTGKKLTKAVVLDETGKMEIIWFNQQYITSAIKQGKKYFFSGKTQKYGNRVNLVSPTFEEAGESTINTGRLIPIYNETRGLTSKWLRTRINDVLSGLHGTQELEDVLPEIIINKYKLCAFEKALNTIHFPNTLEDVIPAKERLGFEELLLEMLKVEDRKTVWGTKYEGVPIEHARFAQIIIEFEKTLPFTLTESQKSAITEIFADLETSSPMNRLLEGDVGSGKTIVALEAAYLSHLNGYKTLYMAPTDILAKQHYQTFTKYLAEFGVDIALKTGTSKKTAVFNENTNIVIGTHALLHEKEGFHNVGLIIIDEQHRFGVEQRAKIVKMGTKDKVPNLLTMTATPIPRTLALTLYGDLDISVLTDVPNVGKKITTKVIPDNFRDQTYKWIKARNEPTFIVCPLIGESQAELFENVKAAEKEYEVLKNGVFAGVSIGLLHGRMTAKEKQQVMDAFKAGEIKVLVSTPVIEVGVDVPEATIMVIESAERYGLASLHQLRGRVGRGEKEGFCFVFMTGYSQTGYTRLKNLEKYNSGLKLAEIDMRFRGQGDIFGTLQHGFKQFKVADINNLEMVEAAKVEAEKLYKRLDEYPKVKKRLTRKTELIAQN